MTYPISNDFGAMAVPPPPPAGYPDAGVVAADVPCRKCQYNLRGLSTDGRCPECGTPVGYSVRGDLLRFSEPTWVGTLRTGVSLILWGILVTIVAAVAAGLQRQQGGLGSVPALVLGLAAGLLSLAGSWLLTTPDPSGLGEDRYGTSRKVIRVTLVVGLAQQVLVLAQRSGAWPPPVNLLFSLLGIVAGLCSVVGLFATLNYLGKLARRIPDAALERRARLVMYGFGVPLAVIIVLSGLVVAVTRAGVAPAAQGSAMISLGCFLVVAFLFMVVFGLMYLFMLGRYSKAFRTAAGIARSTWAAAPPAL